MHTYSLDKYYRAIYTSLVWQRAFHPLIFGLVASAACIIASFCVKATVQALWMKQIYTRGWEMALIPLWCHSRNWEKRERTMSLHIHFSVSCSILLSSLNPLPFFFVLWWAHITGWWTIPHAPPLLIHTSPTIDIPLLATPALSCPAQPCLFQSHRLRPQLQKYQFHAHTLVHRLRKLLI